MPTGYSNNSAPQLEPWTGHHLPQQGTTATRLNSPPAEKPIHCNCGHTTRKQYACCNIPNHLQSQCLCLQHSILCSPLCACQGCQNPVTSTMHTTGSAPQQQLATALAKCVAPLIPHSSQALIPTSTSPNCCCEETSHQDARYAHLLSAHRRHCLCLHTGIQCSLACKCFNCSNPFGAHAHPHTGIPLPAS